ncbi:hypothetical protein O6H91_12G003500 [Diphasiastrum complanatum]|uniref:Uncharacterized protein n=1 Tax=Diphasiastrum complanatum TaxID=34168 RepID=A0ACC2BYG8_DIPCM|nr:hypothetical protein O6H91_12G003500 [Diphasiastrum complanatum]
MLFEPFVGSELGLVDQCLWIRAGFDLSGKKRMKMGKGWLNKFVCSSRSRAKTNAMNCSSIVQGPDEDVPEFNLQFAQFGGGCFWGLELAYQRMEGVIKTEVGYSQGHLHNPTYRDLCEGDTGHSEVVRLVYDPKVCSFETLLNVFWTSHDPTTLNKQGQDVGTQYRSGVYYYTPEQEKAAKVSMETHQKTLSSKIVTEILPAKKFYRAELFHQQYLARGGRFGFKQSAAMGCKDHIRCYG